MKTKDLLVHARIMRNDLAGELPNGVGNTLGALCDRIEQLEAEIASLREGLEPFAEIAAREVAGQFTDDTPWILTNGERRLAALYMRHFRIARALLKGQGK